MNKQEERDHFWISVGPESGYLGTIAEETARKNDGGISPDGERLGWGKQDEVDDDIATRFPYGDPCDASDTTCVSKMDDGCRCGDDCDCGILPLPGMIPSNEMGVPPIPDIGPERQNTMD